MKKPLAILIFSIVSLPLAVVFLAIGIWMVVNWSMEEVFTMLKIKCKHCGYKCVCPAGFGIN